MYDLDLPKLNRSLVKCVKLIVAVRRVIGKQAPIYPEVDCLEREIRAAAAECQRVLELIEADANRPLLTTEKG